MSDVPNDEFSQRYAGEMEAAILEALEAIEAVTHSASAIAARCIMRAETPAMAGLRACHERLLVLMDKIGDERGRHAK